MDISKNDTAVVITDPQNDFLSEQGVIWALVGDSVKENNTIENIERLLKTAKSNGSKSKRGRMVAVPDAYIVRNARKSERPRKATIRTYAVG